MNPALQYYSTTPYYGGYHHLPAYGYFNPYGGCQYYLPTPPLSPQTDVKALGLCSSLPQNHLQAVKKDRFFPSNSNECVDLTLTPQAKRRRLSSHSSVGSSSSECTSPDMGTKTNTPAISSASFIQQSFAPLVTDISKIDNETLTRIMPYHQNMVRKFPKKERTAKEQERRDKNTLACRISRCKEKIKLAAMEQQYALLTARNTELTKEMIPMAAYLDELIRYGVSFKPDARNELAMAMGKTLNLDFLAKMPIKKAHKRNFSIAFLLDLK